MADPSILIGADLAGHLAGLIDRWGYWIVFFGVMLENAGLPVPGETVLLLAGFFASRGRLSLFPVMALAAAGAALGDNCGYWIGRKLGRRFLVRYGKYVFLNAKRLAGLDLFFHKYGDKTVAVARFITGFRVFTALFAGASHMAWPTFLSFNLIGAVTWAATISLLGYFFGRSFELLERWISGAGFVLAIVAVILIVARMAAARRKERTGGQAEGDA